MSKIDVVIGYLRAVDLFRDFETGVLEAIAAGAQERRFAAGQTIFLRGDRGDAMFIVTEGRVRLSVVSAEGRELTVRHAERGSIFGEIALLDGGSRTLDATALQPTSLLAVSQGSFRRVIDDNPAVRDALMRGLCTRLRGTTDQLEAIALMPLEARLARLFLQFCKGAELSGGRVQVPLDISQSELASLIGASRPKVNQVLSAWHSSKVAVHSANAFTIDLPALKRIALIEEE